MKGKEIIGHVVRAEMPDMEQVWERCVNQASEEKRGGFVARRSFKTLAAAAILMVLCATTAFAYGADIVDAVKRVMFGDSTATLNESRVSLSTGEIMIDAINRSPLAEGKVNRQVSFDTLEEAAEAAPFTIKEPSYLPGGFALQNVQLPYFENGSCAYEGVLVYRGTPTVEGRIGPLMIMFQAYLGPGAYVDIQTNRPFEQVMIGDIEALAVNMSSSIILCWVKDEFFYQLSYGASDFDLEVMIKIAESVR